MAQPKPERVSLDHVLRLVEQLSPEEQEQLRRKLDLKSWSEEWKRLQDEVEVYRVENDLPSLTEEEIFAEVTQYRREQRAKRAQSSD